jgi:hypothetical protein
MNWLDASRTTFRLPTSGSVRGSSVPEAYGEELEVLGPLNVGRGYRFSFSYSVADIEILADLTA